MPLSVPAALHAIPPLPASLGAAPHPPVVAPVPPAPHAAPLPDLSSSVGPAGADLLTKTGAALSTKIGITAAATPLAVGGGAAMYRAESRDDHRHAAATSQHVSDELSEHDGSGIAGPHWEGHGWPVHGRLGHRESHAGTWNWQDDGHSSGRSGTTSHHASDGGGTSGAITTHDGGTTPSPTHKGSGNASGTHEPDSGW